MKEHGLKKAIVLEPGIDNLLEAGMSVNKAKKKAHIPLGNVKSQFVKYSFWRQRAILDLRDSFLFLRP